VSRQFLWFSAHTGWLVIAVFTYVLSLSLLGGYHRSCVHAWSARFFFFPSCLYSLISESHMRDSYPRNEQRRVQIKYLNRF
jgi:hypothetical protein